MPNILIAIKGDSSSLYKLLCVYSIKNFEITNAFFLYPLHLFPNNIEVE